MGYKSDGEPHLNGNFSCRDRDVPEGKCFSTHNNPDLFINFFKVMSFSITLLSYEPLFSDKYSVNEQFF